MNDIYLHDQEMRRLYEDIVKIPSTEKKLQSLLNDKFDLVSSANELKKKLDLENEDVENLSKRSLANFFYQLFGKMDDKITKEKAEACEMAVKYKSAVEMLEVISAEVKKYKAQLDILQESEKRYKILFECKSDAIENSGSADGLRLIEIERKQIKSEQDSIEIDEAIHEGECSLEMLKAVMDNLNSAEGWGIVDTFFGGGLISAFAKHDHIDEAEECMKALQKQLGKFKTELADVSIASEFSVGLDGGWKMADILLDGLFVDFMVLSKIDDAIKNVTKLKSEIQSVIEKLNGLKIANQGEMENLKAEKNSIVKSYM